MDFSSQLKGFTIFSTLDLKKGYLQVPPGEVSSPRDCYHHPLWPLQVPPHVLWALRGNNFLEVHGTDLQWLDFIFIYIHRQHPGDQQVPTRAHPPPQGSSSLAPDHWPNTLLAKVHLRPPFGGFPGQLCQLSGHQPPCPPRWRPFAATHSLPSKAAPAVPRATQHLQEVLPSTAKVLASLTKVLKGSPVSTLRRPP